jgi:hypothetical protein
MEDAVHAAYLLGALALAGEAAVHVQQYAAFIHTVRWIGPMFLVDAAVCAVIVIGLLAPRTRVLAALAGVATSAVALASLVVSYGRGLFGWHEAGFRAPLAWAVVTETGAVLLLTSALAGAAFVQWRHTPPWRIWLGGRDLCEQVEASPARRRTGPAARRRVRRTRH